MLTVKIINRSPFELPQYATEGSAGVDLRAAIDQPLTLQPLERQLVPTGIFLELPAGYEGQVRPRSGLSFRKGITLANSPGTIDSDYRGELKMSVVNLSPEPQTIEPGERVAQLVIARYERIVWEVATELPASERGEGGYGSTGIL